MKKVALADVLWKAANEHLSHDGKCKGVTQGYSCPAITGALNDVARLGKWSHVRKWLRSLGCQTSSFTLFSADAFAHTRHTQGLRYIWLLLAMHLAEDEGIMLEIEQ